MLTCSLSSFLLLLLFLIDIFWCNFDFDFFVNLMFTFTFTVSFFQKQIITNYLLTNLLFLKNKLDLYVDGQ